MEDPQVQEGYTVVSVGFGGEFPTDMPGAPLRGGSYKTTSTGRTSERPCPLLTNNKNTELPARYVRQNTPNRGSIETKDSLKKR